MNINVNDLSKRYKQYKHYKGLLEIELLRFKKKYDIEDIEIKINEATSFNTITIVCKTKKLNDLFNLVNDTFEKEFEVKLIEKSELHREYDNKQIIIYNYVYTNSDNYNFDEINLNRSLL